MILKAADSIPQVPTRLFGFGRHSPATIFIALLYVTLGFLSFFSRNGTIERSDLMEGRGSGDMLNRLVVALHYSEFTQTLGR